MKYTIKKAPVVYDKEESATSHINNEESLVDFVWLTWRSLTRRDDPISPKIKDSLESVLGQWSDTPRATIYTLIRQSAHLAPVVSGSDIDSGDTKRLIDTFTSSLHRERGEGASRSFNAAIYPFHEHDIIERRKEDVLDGLDTQGHDLSDHEWKIIYSIVCSDEYLFDEMLDKIDDLDDDELDMDIDDIYQLISPSSRKSGLFAPREYKEKGRKRSRQKSAPRPSSSGYASGRQEEQDVLSPDMEVDLQASGMIDEGYPLDYIMEFHDDVPDGYWDSVLEIVYDPEGSGDPAEAYDLLVEKYSFHPHEREIGDIDD